MFNHIISVNKRCSFWLVEKYPSLFGLTENRYLDTEQKIRKHSLKDLTVLELGGVDRPLLNPKETKYFVGLDVDDQNGLAYSKYDEFYKQSVEDPFNGNFDLIYSITLAEHIKDNTKHFTNIFNSLKKNGKTIHYFPSKNAPYALILRLIGNKLQRNIINLFWKDRLGIIGYQAYFDKCSASEIKNLFKTIGFSNIEIKCYYRANSYFSFFIPFFILVSLFENICRYFNIKTFASGILVQAEKI